MESLESLFDEVVDIVNDEVVRKVDNAVQAASDKTRLDTGRLGGNWDVVYRYIEVADVDPIEVGARKSPLRRDVNFSKGIDRSYQDAQRFDIMTNNKLSIVNATEYAEIWDPIDGMTRAAERELIK